MDIYEKIDNGDYEPKLPYPEKPQRPDIKHDSTQEDFEKYRAYPKAMDEYKKACRAHLSESVKLQGLFAQDAQEYVFGEDVKRFPNIVGALWRLAWEQGHSSGYHEVLNCLQSYSDIMEAVHEDLGER